MKYLGTMLLTAWDISLALRCYVFPVSLYGIEGWALNKETSKRLGWFELWVYRQMLKIFWMDRITTEQVLEIMD